MISHRWKTEHHPDPHNDKLQTIKDWIRLQEQDHNQKYEYVFFDWVCLDQQKEISQSLVTVDNLYAKSHCLCLCDEDYFERSWCLFEIAVNKFNVDSQTLIGESKNHATVKWLEDARLVQQMGYIHSFDHEAYAAGNEMLLELPQDQIHLKTQLRTLLLASGTTNQGDKRFILNLLDRLVQTPFE